MFSLSVMIKNKLTVNKRMCSCVLLHSRMTTNHTTSFIYTDSTGSDVLLKTLCGNCVIPNCCGRTRTMVLAHLRHERLPIIFNSSNFTYYSYFRYV